MSSSLCDKDECVILNFGTRLTFGSYFLGLVYSSQISDVFERRLKVMTSFVRRSPRRSVMTLISSPGCGSISLMAGKTLYLLRLKSGLDQRRAPMLQRPSCENSDGELPQNNERNRLNVHERNANTISQPLSQKLQSCVLNFQ